MPLYTSLAKRASIIADEWPTGKFDGRANAHPCPPLATPLPLLSNIGKEQHERHLYNPSSHYLKYGEDTRETCAPYLDT